MFWKNKHQVELTNKVKAIEKKQEELEIKNKEIFKELATYYKILLGMRTEIIEILNALDTTSTTILHINKQVHNIIGTLKENNIHVEDKIPPTYN